MDYIFHKRPTIYITLNDYSVDTIVIPKEMTFEEIKENLDRIYPNGYQKVTLGETIGCFSRNLRLKQRTKPLEEE